MRTYKISDTRKKKAREEAELLLATNAAYPDVCGRPSVSSRRDRPRAHRRPSRKVGTLDDTHPCQNVAGFDTIHPGVGPCIEHGGNSLYEYAVAGWIIMTRLSGELNTTPWDAMLTVLRRSAHKAALYQALLSEIEDVDDILPGGEAYSLVREAERADKNLAGYARMAHSMGVAEAVVGQLQRESQILVTAMTNALTALGLSPDMIDMARMKIRNELLAIDAEAHGITIEGATTD